MRLADYDLALDYYSKVLRIDFYNVAARRGMEEAERKIATYANGAARDHTRAKMLREVDAQWESQVSISGAFGQPGGDPLLDPVGVRKPIDQLLSEMIVDRINFDEATLDEVVEYLTVKSREVDPSGNGVNFVVQLDANDELSRVATLNLSLRNVPMFEIVKLVARGTGTVYRIDGHAVKFSSKASADRILVTQRFEVPPDFLSSAASGGSGPEVGDPFGDPLDASAGGLSLKRLTAKEFLSNLGVTFPEGATASFNPANSMLLVRNTPSNMQLVRSVVQNSRTTGQSRWRSM